MTDEKAREPVVWADDASPFTGPQVRELLKENERLRAEVVALKADAARLAWLSVDDNLQEIRKRWIRNEEPFDIRGAVDAARKETGR